MSAAPELHQVEAVVHGRYLARSAKSNPPAGIVVGFHGYGENAESHLEALLAIPGIDAWHVAAVQALHPFYNTRTGEVVASWMTRLDRLVAIADNLAYVDRAVSDIRRRAATTGPLVYTGFSQGVAMAYRAAAGANHRCAGLIALGGDVPPELARMDLDGFPRVLLGRGRDDERYSDETYRRDVRLMEEKGIDHETLVFDGGHEWTSEFYGRCGEFLAALGSGGPLAEAPPDDRPGPAGSQ